MKNLIKGLVILVGIVLSCIVINTLIQLLFKGILEFIKL